MKASDLLVRCLEAEGVHYVFGVPGEENADVMMSLEDSRHPRSCSPATSRAPPSWPRSTAASPASPRSPSAPSAPAPPTCSPAWPTPTWTARRCSSSPGQGATTRLHKEFHQVMDVVGMYEPITKWAAVRAPRPQHPRDRAQGRPSIAQTEKPGACLIELPRTSPTTTSTPSPSPPLNASAGRLPTTRSSTRPGPLIQAAERPIILAGNGTIRRRASKQLRAASSSAPASASSARSWPRAVSTWTTSAASSPSASRPGPRRAGHRASRPGDHPRLRHGRVPPAPVEPGRGQDDHPHRLPARRGRRALRRRRRGRRRPGPHALDAERAVLAGQHQPADWDHSHTRAARKAMLEDFASYADDDTERRDQAAEGAVGRPPGARGRTTCCSPTSVPTRCGSPATTSATSPTPA